jgi:hypothetical protein
MLLVVDTLCLAWNAFAFAGQTEKITDAKDVLLLMPGLANNWQWKSLYG